MKTFILFVFSVVVLVGCVTSSPQPEPIEKVEEKPLAEQAKIEALIKQFDNDDWETREKATKELIAMGKKIKPILQKHKNHPDPEVKSRIQYILEEFTPIVMFELVPGMPSVTPYETVKKRLEEMKGVKVIGFKESGKSYGGLDGIETAEDGRFYTKIVIIRCEKLNEMIEEIIDVINKYTGFEPVTIIENENEQDKN